MFWKSANPLEAAKSIVMYGNPDQISKKIENKYKKLSSIIYVTDYSDDNFDRSLEIFSKNVSVWTILLIRGLKKLK